MRHIESRIQQQCVTWFRLQYADLALLLFAVPNGGARNRTEAAIMKGEGVTAGVADMLFLLPNAEHHGLCIEFKTPKGRQQDSQKRFQRKVEAFGYRYEIIHSLDEFMMLVPLKSGKALKINPRKNFYHKRVPNKHSFLLPLHKFAKCALRRT